MRALWQLPGPEADLAAQTCALSRKLLNFFPKEKGPSLRGSGATDLRAPGAQSSPKGGSNSTVAEAGAPRKNPRPKPPDACRERRLNSEPPE